MGFELRIVASDQPGDLGDAGHQLIEFLVEVDALIIKLLVDLVFQSFDLEVQMLERLPQDDDGGGRQRDGASEQDPMPNCSHSQHTA